MWADGGFAGWSGLVVFLGGLPNGGKLRRCVGYVGTYVPRINDAVRLPRASSQSHRTSNSIPYRLNARQVIS